MHQTKKQSLAFSLALLFVSVSPVLASNVGTSPALGKEKSVVVHYGGRIFGIPVVSAKISAAFDKESYAARAELRTAGLAVFFKQIKVVASAKGNVLSGKLSSWEYWHKELDGRKNRELFMNYRPEEVIVRVSPPLRSMGDPPATMAQRLEALDPVSALLSMSLGKKAQEPLQQCNGSIKVFDGKQRYDLRLQADGSKKIRTRAYKGLALRCKVWYVPISGFNADDLNNPEYQKPVIMWMAHDLRANMHLPVRFEAKLDFGTAVVEAIGIDISMGKTN